MQIFTKKLARVLRCHRSHRGTRPAGKPCWRGSKCPASFGPDRRGGTGCSKQQTISNQPKKHSQHTFADLPVSERAKIGIPRGHLLVLSTSFGFVRFWHGLRDIKAMTFLNNIAEIVCSFADHGRQSHKQHLLRWRRLRVGWMCVGFVLCPWPGCRLHGALGFQPPTILAKRQALAGSGETLWNPPEASAVLWKACEALQL